MAVLPLLALASGVVSGIGSLAAAGASSAASEYNAKSLDRAAGVVMAQADEEARAKLRENDRSYAALRVATGANGLSLEGSPLDVLEANAVEGSHDVAKIRYKGEVQAWQLQTQADLKRAEAKSAETAGYIGAASSLLAGATKAGSMKLSG